MGQCHEMDIFFIKFKHFNQYFLCLRWWFSRSFKSFSPSYTIINFLFASLKLLPNFEMLTATLLIIAFSVIGGCSPVSTPHWLQGKCERNNLSRLPVWFYRIKGGFLNDDHVVYVRESMLDDKKRLYIRESQFHGMSSRFWFRISLII